MQSGIQTVVTLTQVTESSSGMTLLEYLARKNSGAKDSNVKKWKDRIEQGFVTVDCEAAFDPGHVTFCFHHVENYFLLLSHTTQIKRYRQMCWWSS